jgi:nucleotide-binding universal stress UspA family protein
MKKILVPTDFSECANNAWQASLILAQKTGAEIHFLHVADIPTDWRSMGDGNKMYPEVTKKVQSFHAQLDKLVDETEKAAVSAHKYLAFNKDYRAILDHISEFDIDLVVMGSRGASGLKEWIVGSNTQKIVRLSPVPVLVTKDIAPDGFKLENLVFVSDFNEEVMEQFKQYVAFTQLFDAKLSLLFINTPENFTDTLTTKINMGNYAMHAPGLIENTYIFNHYSFLRGLNAFCQEYRIDALCMITHGSSTGMHLFNNSLTEKVVNQVKLPVLTMHFSND